MKNLIHVVRLGIILLSPMVLLAQNSQLRRILDISELKYTIDDDGDFRVIFNVGDGHTQAVFVMSKTENLRNEPIVEIWSIGYKSADISKRGAGSNSC